MEDKKKLLVIDSNALLHRAFHALPPLTTKTGEPTGAIYGYLLTLFKAIKDLSPEYIVACFDTKAPTFRHEMFKEYKAQRPKTPEGIITQLPRTKDILKEFKIPVFAKEGVEADDLIATISQLATKESNSLEVYILTGDLDNLQLVNDRIKVYTMGRGIKDLVIYDEEKVVERFEVKPNQMTDFKALVGDTSDNIPGAPGIGNKTAAILIQKYGSLTKIYEAAEKDDPEMKASVKKTLLGFKEQVLLARELVEMKKDVEIDFSLRECFFGKFKKKDVERILTEFDFTTLIKRLPSLIDFSSDGTEQRLLI